MINLRVTLSLDATIKRLSALEQTQLPFAASLAVNRLGEAFQKAERERMARVFTLRRPDFIFREGVKRLGPAATKASPTVTFGIGQRALFLTGFEAGGPRFPVGGGGHLAMPEQIRTNKRGLITDANRPRQIVNTGQGRKAAGRVFVIRKRTGTLDPGIYRTSGRKGRGKLSMLYALEPKVQLPAVLGFEQTAREVVELWPSLFEAALADALRTRKA